MNSKEIKESNKSKRGGSRPGAGRKPGPSRTAAEIAAAVNTGQRVYVKADQAVGVQTEFSKLLDQAGATDVKIAQRIAEGLDAQETVFAKYEGRITDSKDVIAWGERRAYAQLASKAKQLITDEDRDQAPVEVVIKVIGVSFNVPPPNRIHASAETE